MNEEDVRQKMLDIVGDIYNAKFVEHGLNGYTKFDGHTLDEAKYTINKAFDRLEPDHPKVKLPREVGEELDKYKQRGNETYDLIFDLTTYSEELEETSRYIPYDSMDRADRLNAVMDAYRYGWEAEPEAKWYVKAPESWHKDEDCWANIEDGEIDFAEKCWATPFTRAELKQYHLDSDIFTLVPVEDSHED